MNGLQTSALLTLREALATHERTTAPGVLEAQYTSPEGFVSHAAVAGGLIAGVDALTGAMRLAIRLLEMESHPADSETLFGPLRDFKVVAVTRPIAEGVVVGAPSPAPKPPPHHPARQS